MQATKTVCGGPGMFRLPKKFKNNTIYISSRWFEKRLKRKKKLQGGHAGNPDLNRWSGPRMIQLAA